MKSAGRCVTVPHAEPLSGVRTHAEGRRLITLIQHPRPLARAAGAASWDTPGATNPYEADPDSADAVNWDAGRNDRLQEDN